MGGRQKAVNKKAVVNALNVLDKNRTGIVLTGKVKDGKVILDEASLAAVARKFPKAQVSFIAVNAPFDPHTNSVDEASA